MSTNIKQHNKKKKRPKRPHEGKLIAKRKEALLEALRQNKGIVKYACESVDLDRGCFYRYYNDDPVFRAAADECNDIALDITEHQLFKKIEDGDIAAIIFYLKCRGKKRGYFEKQVFGLERQKETYLSDKEKSDLADLLDGKRVSKRKSSK